MAFTFTRLYVDDAATLNCAELIEALSAHQFRPIDLDSDDATSSGWCAFGGTYEPGVGDPVFGQCIAFGLRTDTLRIPPARLKHEVEIERRREQEGRDEPLNRYQVAELKASVVARLRRTTPPTISHVPVVLDLDAGVLWVFSASESVIEVIDGLFMRTTEHTLTRETVYTRLDRQGVTNTDELGAFDALRCDEGRAIGGDMLDRILRCEHLAPEFLLWLWWRCERDGGAFDLGGEIGEFELWLDDRMVLGGSQVNAQTDTFHGGHPASSSEAREALRLGKLPEQAKIRIVRRSQTWQMTVKASALTLAGVKIPSVLSSEDDDLLAERMMLLEHVVAIIDGLLRAFIADRTAADWPVTHEAIRTWAQNDYEPPVVADDVRELLRGSGVESVATGVLSLRVGGAA